MIQYHAHCTVTVVVLKTHNTFAERIKRKANSSLALIHQPVLLLLLFRYACSQPAFQDSRNEAAGPPSLLEIVSQLQLSNSMIRASALLCLRDRLLL